MIKKIIRFLFNKKNEKNIPNEVMAIAFHEAGHIVFAYLAEWEVKRVKIYRNEQKQFEAVTKYDFRKDDKIVKALSDSKICSSLTQDELDSLYLIATKRSLSVLGGPLSEAFYRGELPENIYSIRDIANEADLAQLQNIDITAFEKFREKDFSLRLVKQTIGLLHHQIVWEAISMISDALINADDYTLNNTQITSILNSSKFFKFRKDNFS